MLQQVTSEAVTVLPAPVPLRLLDMGMHVAPCLALLGSTCSPCPAKVVVSEIITLSGLTSPFSAPYFVAEARLPPTLRCHIVLQTILMPGLSKSWHCNSKQAHPALLDKLSCALYLHTPFPPMLQKFVMQDGMPAETAMRIYRRYLQLEPMHTEEYIAYLRNKVSLSLSAEPCRTDGAHIILHEVLDLQLGAQLQLHLLLACPLA